MSPGQAPPRLTPAGGALLLVTAAATVVLAAGPQHDRVPAVVVLAVCAALILMRAGPRLRERARQGQRARRDGPGAHRRRGE